MSSETIESNSVSLPRFRSGTSTVTTNSVRKHFPGEIVCVFPPLCACMHVCVCDTCVCTCMCGACTCVCSVSVCMHGVCVVICLQEIVWNAPASFWSDSYNFHSAINVKQVKVRDAITIIKFIGWTASPFLQKQNKIQLPNTKNPLLKNLCVSLPNTELNTQGN